jgi:hypothetical protein
MDSNRQTSLERAVSAGRHSGTVDVAELDEIRCTELRYEEKEFLA